MALEVGLDDGGVGRADEVLLPEDGATQGTVVMRPLVGFGPAGAGRPGNELLPEEVDEEAPAVPHDRVCETEDREDWAVDDFSLRTRVDFAGAEDVEDEDGVEDITRAQPCGKASVKPLGPGKDG